MTINYWDHFPSEPVMFGEETDIHRIVEASDRLLTPGQAAYLWTEISANLMASWLVLPDDDQRLKDMVECFLAGWQSRDERP